MYRLGGLGFRGLGFRGLGFRGLRSRLSSLVWGLRTRTQGWMT